MEQDTLENRSLEIINDGEEGSVLNYRSIVGMEFVFHEMFEDGDLPSGWLQLSWLVYIRRYLNIMQLMMEQRLILVKSHCRMEW